MCHFCHAQLFEITHAENIKSPLEQPSCQNAKVVEAFCDAGCRLSTPCRPLVCQPPVDALRVPAEMPIAPLGSPAGRHPRCLVRVSCLPSSAAQHAILIAFCCPAGRNTSRDFVPWRFSDAGRLSLRMVRHSGVRKTLYGALEV